MHALERKRKSTETVPRISISVEYQGNTDDIYDPGPTSRNTVCKFWCWWYTRTHARNAAITLAIAICLSAAIRVHFLGRTQHQVLLSICTREKVACSRACAGTHTSCRYATSIRWASSGRRIVVEEMHIIVRRGIYTLALCARVKLRSETCEEYSTGRRQQ
jgi:hypothetical protein